MRIVWQRTGVFRGAVQPVTNQRHWPRCSGLSAERSKSRRKFGKGFWPRAPGCVLLQSAEILFGKHRRANWIAFVWIDRHELNIGCRRLVSANAHKQALHLPGGHAIFQLFRKAIWICSSVERLDNHPRSCLVVSMIVTRD